jgi:hypothetical protein
MFDFLRRSQHNQPMTAITAALGSNGLPPGMDPSTLVIMQQRGSYSGRQVSYFRVFDPVRAQERRVQVKTFGDLDSHPELVLISGHREQDGAVALTRRGPVVQAAATPARSQATRSEHADDEQIVFPGAAS